jgi:hypothetical protein
MSVRNYFPDASPSPVSRSRRRTVASPVSSLPSSAHIDQNHDNPSTSGASPLHRPDSEIAPSGPNSAAMPTGHLQTRITDDKPIGDLVSELDPPDPHQHAQSATARRQTQNTLKHGTRPENRAATRSGRYYPFVRLGDVRLSGEGPAQVEVEWTPTWLPLVNLRGEQAFKEAEELIIGKFGRDVWEREAHASGLPLSSDLDTEIEGGLD